MLYMCTSHSDSSVLIKTNPGIPNAAALLPVMTGPQSHLEVEMFLDEAKFAAAIGQEPKWIMRQDVPQPFAVAIGLSPNLFPNSKGVPFKYASARWSIAKEHFDKAHTGGWVTGPPTHLVQVRMRSEWALTHFINKDLIADPWYDGVYFTKPVNVENYPGIQMTVSPILGSDIPVR